MRGPLFILGGSIVIIGSLLVKGILAQVDGLITEDLYDNEDAIPSHEQYQYTTPPCCKTPSVEDVSFVLISTMDGKLVALDTANGGATVWETDGTGGPLLSGSIGRMQPIQADGRVFSLIPALDGSLYMYSDEDKLLEPIPLSTDMLLQASVRIGHDAVAGGKTVATTGIDPLTGKTRYHCSAVHCDTSSDELVSSTLVFRRSTNAVRAVDALTGTERWNLSVSEYDASLVLDHTGTYNHVPHQSRIRILVQPPDGIVTAVDSCGNQLWTRQLDTHIAKTWRMEEAQLTELSLFDPENIHTLALSETPQPSRMMQRAESLFYLGSLDTDQYFIIHSNPIKNELKRLARNNQEIADVAHLPGTQLMRSTQNVFFVQDRTIDDLLSSSFRNSFAARRASRDTRNQLGHAEEKDLQVVSHTRNHYAGSSCPNSDGIALIGEQNIRSASFRLSEKGDQGWFVLGGPSQQRMIGSSRSSQCATTFLRKVEEKLDTWWKVSLSCIAVIIFTGLSTVGLVHLRRRKRTPAITMTAPESTEVSRKSAETRSTSCGPSVMGAESLSSAPPTPPTPVNRERRTTSNESGGDSFQSKFLVDFEPEKFLGHGGFGMVFKAKNRLDEGSYAVKRIAVANNEVAIQRVLREVRAMARLDHPGIIRYYHTWIEKPPPGYQEEMDRILLTSLKKNKLRKTTDELTTDEMSVPEPPEEEENVEKGDLSLAAPNMPDSCSNGSWLDDSKEEQMEESDTSTDSEHESSSDMESSSGEPMKVIPSKFGEESHSVVFGEKDSKTSPSKSSLEMSKIGTQMVLVTSMEEDLLPSRNTHNFVYLYIQMQLCQEKTLHYWLCHRKLPEDRPLEKMKMWLSQLCSATSYIHREGLIHRDIKPQNIFFSTDDHLKIGDLGLVTKVVTEDEIPLEESKRMSSSSLHTGNVGTKGYMSPEQLMNKPYTSKVDVFSLGLIFCEMVVPFQTLMERSLTLGDLQNGRKPAVLEKYGEEEKKMIYWMTEMDPQDRPTCLEILDSQYLEDTQIGFERTASMRRRRHLSSNQH